MDHQSRMHRFEVDDVVEYRNEEEHPPVVLTGKIVSFANEEQSYINCDFGEEVGTLTLTEDEVRRVA